MTPSDFAVIYDVAALYSQSLDGAGQSIAVAGRSNLNLSDVQAFRSRFGLPVNNPAVVVNGPDPGVVSTDELGEAELDVEWAGAVAKNASCPWPHRVPKQAVSRRSVQYATIPPDGRAAMLE